jgi:N-acetylglucosaminyldiphosphoundecaprenol N-acetyl-beta-D-mannosaminyltransferase
LSSPKARRLEFLGISLTEGSTNDCLELIRSHSDLRNSAVFHLVNTYTCTIFANLVDENPLLQRKSINLLDGYWLRRHLENKTKSSVKSTRGPDVFERAFSPEMPVGDRHLLLGSTPENLQKLALNLVSQSKGAATIQSLSLPFGPFSDETYLEIAELASRFKPHVVWLGLGTPKQDFVAQQLCELMNTPIVCVGAAFDFLSGSKRTAPRWVQKIGLEWLFRLASEPRRLWKRYLIGNLKFMILAIRDLRTK